MTKNNFSYDSEELVKAYMTKKRYAVIHDDIFDLIQNYDLKGIAMDLGSCTGLLGCRLVGQKIFKKVIGIEAEKERIERAAQHKNVEHRHLNIKMETLPSLEKIIKEEEVTTIVARKFFSEIYLQDKNVVELFPQMFYDLGVEKIVIEGNTGKHKHGLYKMQKEANLFEKYYKLYAFYNECCILERRGRVQK